MTFLRFASALVVPAVLCLSCGSPHDEATSSVRCGAGTVLRDGACEVDAREPPDAAVAEDAGGTETSSFSACTSLRLAGRVPLAGVVDPQLVSLDDGSALLAAAGGGMFVRAIGRGGQLGAADTRLGRDVAATVRSASITALPGARAAVRWNETAGPTVARGAVAVVDATGQVASRREIEDDHALVLGSTPLASGFRVLASKWDGGVLRLVVVDHGAGGEVAAEHVVPLPEGASIDPTATAITSGAVGGSIVVVAYAPPTGTGRIVSVIPISAEGVAGALRVVAATSSAGPFTVASSGEVVLVGVGEGAPGRDVLALRLFRLATTGDEAPREIGAMSLPVAAEHAPEAKVVWGGARFWLLTRGETLAARWIDRAGLLGPEQTVLDDASLTTLSAATTRDALVVAWVSVHGKERAGELATFGCTP